MSESATLQPHDIAVVHNHWIHYKDLLFRAMAGAGLDFTVLFTAAASAQRLAGSARGSPYSYWVAHEGPYETVSQTGIARKVWGALNRVRPACVIISGWYDAAAWSAWLWGNVHRVPMILWAESNHFDRARHRPLEALKRLYVRRFRAAHVYGRSNKEYLRSLGFPEERIFTKRAVLDTARFVPARRVHTRAHHKTLLFVGRFAPEKNLERLLLAFSMIPQSAARPRLVLRLAGYGPVENDLRRLTSSLGLDRFVEFHGPANQSELPAVYAAADAVILPSVSETWGLVVNEAMCCGLPALVSNRCGCAADLVDPRTGWTFDPADLRQLSDVLDRFADTPRSRLVQMGEAARARASHYSPASCAAIVAESVRMVLKQNFPSEIMESPRCTTM